MIIYSYWFGWNGDRLLEILDMKTEDEALLREAVQILIEDGALDYAKEKSKTMLEDAWKDIEPLLKTCDAKDHLSELS
jgi:geranylgeranyl pyrophosphate synthase